MLAILRAYFGLVSQVVCLVGLWDTEVEGGDARQSFDFNQEASLRVKVCPHTIVLSVDFMVFLFALPYAPLHYSLLKHIHYTSPALLPVRNRTCEPLCR